MGFGQKSFQQPPTNYQAKNTVNYVCGGTGKVTCTTSTLYPASLIPIINSIQLISNTNNIYEVSVPYVYLATFNVDSDYSGYWNLTMNLTNTTNSSLSTSFEVSGNSGPSSPYSYPYGVFILTSSNITTSQTITSSGQQYYTINSGTYSISYTYTQLNNGIITTYTIPSTTIITFGQVNNPTISPTQTITIN